MYFSSQLRFQHRNLSLAENGVRYNKLQIAIVMMSTLKFFSKQNPHHIFLSFVVDAELKLFFLSFTSNLLMSNLFQHLKKTRVMKRNIHLGTNSFP